MQARSFEYQTAQDFDSVYKLSTGKKKSQEHCNSIKNLPHLPIGCVCVCRGGGGDTFVII